MLKGRLLIIEDEVIVARYMKDILESFGYYVVACPSGEEAIKLVKEFHPDLAFVDIVLKGSIDGIETARYLNTTLGIPVVYVTAYTDEETLSRVKDTDYLGYLVKPFDDKDIYVSVELAMHKRRTKKMLKKPLRRVLGSLNKDELKILLFFVTTCSTDSWIHIPLHKIAKEVNSDIGNVSRAIRSLCKKGYVEILKSGRENYYRLSKDLAYEENI
ncbi:MAG: response regulator [Hydrogenobacter thermophilus]|uniref:Response regulator n=1 Tax=Hydrogenobacter thermophilus (strain DSM 6534 / IAM 12695 / TK-6) TaxID=608538 RepID=D3DJJ5_HYDTT|nr:response regulator [Hydrogenobacter thermophilus]ADO45920.1 response regulator receiver protein [Hydrogenobacter thermophilus TK-6]MCS7284983.1 response regulator [Hydrogenobacter thermophilus]BAI69997.1 response regulator [Hydrogenobacter thermophilus TK-6]